MSSHGTPSQTVGPFFQIGLSWLYAADLAGPDAADAITLRGRVLDGDGQPVPDAVLEIWQADAQGRYADPEGAHAGFRGFGRVATDESGGFSLRTIKPGSVEGQAPHLNITLFMRGLLRALAGRVYFADEPRNVDDPVLLRVPSARRATLPELEELVREYLRTHA